MPEVNPEPGWKKNARNLFFLFAIVTVISFPLAGFFTIGAHNRGAAQPADDKVVKLTQHGNTKYITQEESNRIRLMWMIFLCGLPSTAVLGLVLRFGFRVDIFKEEPKPLWFNRLMNNLRRQQP